MPRAEIYCCSTLLSLATAAVAGGVDAHARSGAVRRVLLVADYAPEAEAGLPLLDRAATAPLAALFDVVIDVNELIAPYHPGAWSPGEAAELVGRLLLERCDLGPDPALFVEPYQVNFARWLMQLFPASPITVIADGLMAYGPSRRRVPDVLAHRLVELAHLDLVPGLVPVYLSEHRVPSRAVATSRVRAVLDGLADSAPWHGVDGSAAPGVLILGQYLSALGILSEMTEQELYLDAVVAASRRGYQTVAFKPHPAASGLLAHQLQRDAAARGVTLDLVEASGPAELLFGSGRYQAVHGCFSTGLFTASRLYSLDTLAFGTGLLLEQLTPYENSNRIPVTLSDLLLSDQGSQEHDDAGRVLRAVSYCMQAKLYPGLRTEAAQTLAAHPQWRKRYTKRRRLRALDLPGGDGAVSAAPQVSTAALPQRMGRRVVRAARRAGPAAIERLRHEPLFRCPFPTRAFQK